MTWIQIFVTIFCSVLASSGFWTFILKRREKKDAKTQLILGLAQERILTLATSILNRGVISCDEYTFFEKNLFTPYLNIGGNGTAHHLIEEVRELPIVRNLSDAKNGEDV